MSSVSGIHDCLQSAKSRHSNVDNGTFNMPLRTPLISSLLAVVLLSSETAVAASTPQIEVLRASEVQSICGCNFQLPAPNVNEQRSSSERTFLQWGYDEDAFMRIDGNLIRLKVEQESSKTTKATPSVGDTVIYRLRNNSFRVRVLCTANQVCSPGDDSCEAIGYQATVAIKSVKGNSLIKATGACGC